MGRLTITVCIIVCMAVAAGCGGGSSSTTAASTAKPVFSNSTTFTLFSTATMSLLGGNVQKGPFASKHQNFSTVTSPAFRNVTGAAFNGPIAVTTDGTGNWYVVNFTSHNIVRIAADGEIRNHAGSGYSGFANSSSARPLTAAFSNPTAIASDGTDLYVADTGNHIIRRIEASGRTSVLAGIAGTIGSDDTNTSLSVVASFNQPSGVSVAGGFVFVTDTLNHTIRMINKADGTVTTLAGYPGASGSADGDRTMARFNLPARITSDGRNLYVTDFGNRTVRRISLATGKVDTIAGVAGQAGTTNGPRGTSLFNHPNGIASDGVNLYVTDSYVGSVRRIELTSGTFVTSTIFSGLDTPIGVTTDGSGLFISDRNANSIVRIK
ncbi:MAG: hypothetical protein A2X82_12680 [Geobacteraceae bacterium GWC2_55_20]|nr:MAG: hypothetical protein A2X82_12680 [Geobacteraceae bacterium GWC2_55_20]OGU22708.1 MAG: hypothetical protein A2X85_06940 [Geobacteraceae bacterium GWF2_54_21]HCE67317.1 hypothetical protein [Geobacter sp.]